ncbi:kinase-like domain-containing protein [Daedaleopsis nitida]|nr:kinase-like domain-containing protein [Daedaleopsis nitida]
MQHTLPQQRRDSPSPVERTVRPTLSAVFGYEPRTFNTAYEESTGELLDQDQYVSTACGLSFSPPPLVAISEPPLPSLFGSPVISPLPVDDFPETDLSSSPAAMFLSAFSPAVSEMNLAPDDEGATVAGYTLGPIVGHGGFSIIRKAFSAGGTVAVKIIRRADLDKQPDTTLARKSVEREAEVWASLNHEHILPLFTVTHTPYADFFFTAYCPAGSLFDILKRDGRPALPQDDAGMMFRQVVRGLRYMHEVAGYVHGDLKPENVLVDDMGVCKIGDFGMTRKIGEVEDDVASDEEGLAQEREKMHRSRTISQALPAHRTLGRQVGKLPPYLPHLRRHGVPARHRTSSPYPASGTPPSPPNRGFAPGSLPYAAPELLLSPTAVIPYAADPAQDMWALGVMLYTLLTGKLPFSDSFEPRLQMKILHGVFDMPQGIGRCAEQALRGCIERSVSNRWTVAMVDEVAWGIGWGSAADDVTPPETIPRSPSRPRVQSAQEQTERRNRSTSRAARSSTRSTSVVRTPSRSKSRPPHHPHENAHPYHHPLLQTSAHAAHPLPTQPSLSSLTNAILRTTSAASSDPSSTHFSPLILQPTLTSEPDVACQRGRMPRQRFPPVDVSVSRSRSPLEMPATPRDESIDLLRRRKSPPSRPSVSTPDLGHPVPELDTLEEDARWQLSPDTENDSRSRSRFRRGDDDDDESSSFGSRPRGRPFSRSRDELRKAMRNGSMPPALSPTRSSAWAPSARGYPARSGCATAVAAPATPIAIPGAVQATRSRSMGPEGPREGRFRPVVSHSLRTK